MLVEVQFPLSGSASIVEGPAAHSSPFHQSWKPIAAFTTLGMRARSAIMILERLEHVEVDAALRASRHEREMLLERTT